MSRYPTSRPRLIALTFFLIVAVAVAWRIVGNTSADSQALTDPETALRWRPALPAALLNLAEQRLVATKDDDDLAAVAGFARGALRASSLEEAALRLLGLVAELRGDARRAQVLMTLAGARSLRDTVAQIWLFDQSIRSNGLARALPYADAVMRTRPDLNDKLIPALALAATEPTARQPLIKLLARDPPWRPWLLSALPQSVDSSVFFAVLSDLQNNPRPLRNSEIQPYLAALVGGGQFELAYLAWLHFLPSDVAEVRYVYNGDFALVPMGLAFDWMISSIAGAATEVVDSGDVNHGKALRVTFADTRVPYSNIAKLMILPPGAFRLSGSERVDSLVTERGMSWRIYCAEGAKQLLAASPVLKGTTPWQGFAAAFVVPSTDCRAQWLKLELDARVALEQQISGEAWFDDLRVERQVAGLQGDGAQPAPGSQ